MIPLLFTISIVTFVTLFGYVGNHGMPSRRSGRERLLAANPCLNVITWPDEVVDVTIATTDVRRRLTAIVVSTLLYVGVAVDRRPVDDAPSWYDHR